MRNSLHVILGIFIMFTIGFLTKFSTYSTEGKYIGVPLLSIFLGAFAGLIWEAYWNYKIKQSQIDLNDIIRTATGFLIGGLIATL